MMCYRTVLAACVALAALSAGRETRAGTPQEVASMPATPDYTDLRLSGNGHRQDSFAIAVQAAAALLGIDVDYQTVTCLAGNAFAPLRNLDENCTSHCQLEARFSDRGMTTVAAAIGLSLANKMAILTRIRPTLFGPIILVVCMIGSFALRNNMGDVIVTVVFGLLGYEMRKFGFSRIALILGLLLGNMAEINFRQALMVQTFWRFFTRPISLVLFLLIMAG